MAAEMCAQLSLLAFVLRIFVMHGFKKVVWALMVIVTCFGIANTLVMMFQCTPISFFWTSWTGENPGKCLNSNMFSWIRGGLEIALDLCIIALPFPLLLKLQMSTKRKIQVISMFCVGFVYVWSFFYLSSRELSFSVDDTYANADNTWQHHNR